MYSDLDADAVASIYPKLDRKALARAFQTLNWQQILFDECRILVGGTTADATCAGTVLWTPKVGRGWSEQRREWRFALNEVDGRWSIRDVKIR